MRQFQHVTPALRLFSGAASLGSLERELSRLGSARAVIICGRTIGNSPLIDLVRCSAGNRIAGVFAGVRAHSPLPDVLLAEQALRDASADAVIAIGGGSAIVTARAASILLAEGGDVAALATRRGEDGRLVSPRLDAPKLPQLVIPTTPTTAIVKAGSAVFEPVTQTRLALFDPKTRSQSVFLHPEMLATAPAALLTSAAVNSFAMAIEGLISPRGDPIADGQLMHALRLIKPCFAASTVSPEMRGDLLLAAILCGQGTDHSGAGVTTVLGHALGARHGVENGLINAVMLPHVLRYNAGCASDGLAKVAAALSLSDSTAESVAEAVKRLFGLGGIAQRLRDLEVPRDDLPATAEHAMSDWFLGGNPRRVGAAGELVSLLEAAW